MTRDWLASLLQERLSAAEERLYALGRPRDAWKVLKPYVSVEFGYHPDKASQALGPLSSPNNDLLPDRQISVMPKIQRHWKRCQRCKSAARDLSGLMADHKRLAELERCRPELFKQYRKEVSSKVSALVMETPDWRAGFAAALSNLGLTNLDPAETFAIGAALERQRVLELLAGRFGPKIRREVRQSLVAEIRSGRHPEIEKVAVGIARGRIASQQQVARQELVQPIHDAIRMEFEQRRGRGLTCYAAAVATWKDASLRARCSELARELEMEPWQGEFYSLGAIRKIVGS